MIRRWYGVDTALVYPGFEFDVVFIMLLFLYYCILLTRAKISQKEEIEMHFQEKVQIFGISGNPEYFTPFLKFFLPFFGKSREFSYFFTCSLGISGKRMHSYKKKMANKHCLSAILYIILKRNPIKELFSPSYRYLPQPR